MPRKKVSSVENEDENLPNMTDLEDGEKIIISDTRTIQKQHLPVQRGETPIIDADPDDEYFLDDEEQPKFSSTSIAALIHNDSENLENEFCSIHVRREPDKFGDKFLNPQSSRLKLQTFSGVPLSQEREEIEEKVRAIHGGGHYFFQIHYKGQFVTSWNESLADTPEAIAKAKAEFEKQNQPASTTSPEPASSPGQTNPFEQFFSMLKQEKEMKELLFGAELKELEELRKKNSQPATEQQPQSEKLQILQYVEKMNPQIQDKVLGFIFDEDTGGGLFDTVKWIFSNGDQVKSFVSMMFGGMMPTAQMQPNDIATMLKRQPPNAENVNQNPQPQPKREAQPGHSTFKRKKPALPEKTEAGEKGNE
jgi:hypothetical protein